MIDVTLQRKNKLFILVNQSNMKTRDKRYLKMLIDSTYSHLKGTCKNYFRCLCIGNIEVMTISECLLTSHPPSIFLLNTMSPVPAVLDKN
jgi:hypothetical protein